VNERLHAMATANGNTFSGCWDVVAWKNDRLVFAESKKAKNDRMRGTQLKWLEAALRCGCSVEDFLVVEWGLGTCTILAFLAAAIDPIVHEPVPSAPTSSSYSRCAS
jgi:hypothetical protein